MFNFELYLGICKLERYVYKLVTSSLIASVYSGKTTTLEMLEGLRVNDGGSISVVVPLGIATKR